MDGRTGDPSIWNGSGQLKVARRVEAKDGFNQLPQFDSPKAQSGFANLVK